MKVSVTLDQKSYNDTQTALRNFGKDAAKVVKKVVDKTALTVSTDAQNKLKQDNHIKTNRLRASIHPEYRVGENHGMDSLNERFGNMEAISGTNVVYAPHIEFGTKPHIIEPKNKKFLSFMINGVSIFTKKVNHPGFKGSSFMRWSAERNKEPFQKRMAEELNRLINKGPRS